MSVLSGKDGTTAIKQLLTYLNCSKIESVTNDNIAQIHNYVSDIKHSAEVKHRFMTIGEWFDRHQAIAVAEGLAEGRAEGLALGRINLLFEMLEELGELSDNMKSLIREADEDTLKDWIKLAEKVDGLEVFEAQIKKN